MRRILIPALFVLLGQGAMAQHQGHGTSSPPAPTTQAPAGGHGAMHGSMHGKAHGGAASANESASTKAYRAANDKMHKDMDIRFTGDADVDFFKGMIPHHQGAIDMARVVLQHGKDAETRKLAQEIIAAQEKEIAQMKDWLKKRGQ